MDGIEVGQKWKYQEPARVQPIYDLEVLEVNPTHVVVKFIDGPQMTLTRETFLRFAKPARDVAAGRHDLR
jgi:hypothetical protein